MHAVVVRVTIHNADRTREVLNSQVVPQVSGAPGFKAGYWTWATGDGETDGLSMIIFDSEKDARAAGDRIRAIAADAPDDVTLDGVEVQRSSLRPDVGQVRKSIWGRQRPARHRSARAGCAFGQRRSAERCSGHPSGPTLQECTWDLSLVRSQVRPYTARSSTATGKEGVDGSSPSEGLEAGDRRFLPGTRRCRTVA